ncbi:primary-amine oxidase [Wickerhamomyces ciferrii]|uniref:Amine oxidase n=1 Tax=Wickerhamomyces ciferrii (strain ATCC 14091 / BCRC 22168 / CBS 111 / JCM 3599 / NBRC 0793 / NRRL Y-1031 F-60-10) TaxID=1206466 RepID=K0KK14_WICCF|nr:primary-amine oxidase [Wickerhamomyces ciferrii]CCH45595.1 primary-amine oxidase [Wickerhamomyces ciferrii]
MERLQQIASQTTASAQPPPLANHPLDPLSIQEIKAVVSIVKENYSGKNISFNVVTLKEPSRKSFIEWREKNGPRPPRLAFFVILEAGKAGVQEGVVDIGNLYLTGLKHVQGVQPILTVEDLCATESIIRKDPTVIEQCRLSGVPADEMHKVYCDPWTIGYDERWGNSRRLQQAMMYYRANEDDSQYSHPLDFVPIVDTETHEVIFIDIPSIRRPLSKQPHSNFYPADVVNKYGYRDHKPINVTQPEGVSFKMEGNVIEWENFNFHIGFNYREGIVLSDIKFNDHGKNRPIFHRMSLSEMIVPYGDPTFKHFRKHALDIGEYGAGYMTNPLSLGCDCKGVIHYLDAHFAERSGDPITIKNAICIHEEDDGILYKHSDFRDNFSTSIVTRATRLVISQIFTAANYEYCIYWNFLQDGSIRLDIKLTGILNTYVANKGEKTGPYGTQVYPHVNAHNHQHLFSLRIDPRIDGDGNSVASSDVVSDPHELGSLENPYGNGWFGKKTIYKTVAESLTHANAETSRSWDILNPNSINPYSGNPASYKIVSTQTPRLLAKENSIPSKRAPWARHAMNVVKYDEDRLYPSGVYVPQSSGDGPIGIRGWIGDGTDKIENTDVIVFHTFGISHVPAPEDFPLMPAEPITLLMRPRNFFTQNPALDIKPSYAMTTSGAKKLNGETDVSSILDKTSKLAFSNTSASFEGSCCSKK